MDMQQLQQKAGGKGGPFNMASMLNALRAAASNTTKRIKRAGAAAAPAPKKKKFSVSYAAKVAGRKPSPRSRKNKTIKVVRHNISDEKMNRMYIGLRMLYNNYNKADEPLLSYYGTIAADLKSEFEDILGERFEDDDPVAFLVELKGIIKRGRFGTETRIALYKAFNRILSEYKAQKADILEVLRDSFKGSSAEAKMAYAAADEEMSRMFGGLTL
jgi:hypothetical protein